MPAPKPLQHRRRRFARGNGLSRRGQRRRRAMRPLDVVPEPLAQLPWKIILLTLMIGGFGLMMLYSAAGGSVRPWVRSEEHTSELPSLMRISYAVFCLKKKKHRNQHHKQRH